MSDAAIGGMVAVMIAVLVVAVSSKKKAYAPDDGGDSSLGTKRAN